MTDKIIQFDPALNVWDRQKGEPSKWFDRFEKFRLLGPQRTYIEVYRQEKEAATGESHDHLRAVPSTWRERGQQWQWRERASAWDRHMVEVKRGEEEQERVASRDRRASLIKRLQTILDRATAMFDQEVIDTKELLNLVRAAQIVMNQSRLEYGEVTDRIEVSTHHIEIPAEIVNLLNERGTDIDEFTQHVKQRWSQKIIDLKQAE